MSDTQSVSMEAAQITGVNSGYAQKRKQHLALINQLRAIGAQADLDLPRIAVIGNQSAGKSSLVEAISGISVPRDAGTCTRCPMECRLASSAGPWSCQVYIRWEFQTTGERQDEVKEVTFGSLLTDKKDVELMLRRAQAAVLNPKIHQSKFLDKSENDLKRVKNGLQFSRNAVCLDLSGPELTDLSFVDLPGIIQNADPETVKLVEDLVTSNIMGNCLILVTLPMSDDIENQKAARLAKQEDPSGIRTIGVITKPDTLPAGATKSRDLWLDVIEGRRFPLRHGYYCTRQPDDDERAKGITTMQARAAEKDFFANTKPWCASSRKRQFGTSNLVESLSKLLTHIIDDALPKLKSEVASQLETCNDELNKLPPAITADPSSFVLTLVSEFCNEVKLRIKGGDTRASTLIQANHKAYATYKRDIRHAAPPFLPFPSSEEADPDVHQYLRLDEDGEATAFTPLSGISSGALYLNDVREHIRRSRARELPNNVPYAAKVALIDGFQSSWEMDSRTCFAVIFATFENALLQLISQQFQRYDTLRSSITYAVRELLRSKHEDTWTNVEMILNLEKAMPYTQNSHYLQVTKDKNLSLYKAARAEARDNSDGPPTKRPRIETRTATASTAQTSPLASGRDYPMPINGGRACPTTPIAISKQQPVASASKQTTPATGLDKFTFSQPPTEKIVGVSPANSPAIAASSTCFSEQGPKRGLDDEDQKKHQKLALSSLAALGIHVTVADLGKLHPPDIYEEELEVMAEVRAYFQVAYKRVIDYVPMVIDKTFLFAFAESLQGCLIEKLGLGMPNSTTRCATYLSEEPDVVARRDELTSKKARLQTIQTELFNFGL